MSTNVKKGLVLLNVIFLLGLGVLAVYQHSAINHTINSLEETSIVLKETTKVLSTTQTKVKQQDENIDTLTEDNNVLQIKITEQSDSLDKVTADLKATNTKLKTTSEKLTLADKKKAEQEKEIQKLKEDLAKKKASRIASSAVPQVKAVAKTKTSSPSQGVRTASSKQKNTNSNTSGMMTFSSTAYSYGTTTASGTHVQEGRTIAVDPNVIPLGSKVRITCPDFPSINGVYTAEDTGGVVHGNIIDIYMQSYDKAIQFGRRTIYVEVL